MPLHQTHGVGGVPGPRGAACHQVPRHSISRCSALGRHTQGTNQCMYPFRRTADRPQGFKQCHPWSVGQPQVSDRGLTTHPSPPGGNQWSIQALCTLPFLPTAPAPAGVRHRPQEPSGGSSVRAARPQPPAQRPPSPGLLTASGAFQWLFVSFKQWLWPVLFSLPLPRFSLLYRAGAFFFFPLPKSMGSECVVLKVTFQIPARDRSPQIVLSTPAEHERLFISV